MKKGIANLVDMKISKRYTEKTITVTSDYMSVPQILFILTQCSMYILL